MRYLIMAVWFLIPVIFCVFVYWLAGNDLDRSPNLALAASIGMIIGAALASMYTKESDKK